MSEPQTAAPVQRLRDAADSTNWRMHGRDAELGILQAAFRALWTEARLEAITLVAEAGLGKSRLLQAFDDACEASPGPFTCYRGGAVPTTQEQPFGLLRDILAAHGRFTERDAPETARARFEQTLLPQFGPPCTNDESSAHVHRLGYLIGLGYGDSPHVLNIVGDPRQVRQRGLDAALHIFRHAGAGTPPVLIQIEDLHWADNESLDFLQQLLDSPCQRPLLLLCSTRPVLFERRPDWADCHRADGVAGAADGLHRRITLAPLDKTASRDLADALLGKLVTIPTALRELVVGSADGNPFQMEQMVGLLLDAGALCVSAEGWAVDADKLLATPWPTTLTGVLQARLAALPAAQRRALQQASVIGPVFSREALLALGGAASLSLPTSLTREVSSFRAAGLQPDNPSGGRQFCFWHQVLQVVAYKSLPGRSRRALHKRLALWLAGLTGLQATHAPGVTADHFELAGETTQAAEHHAQAAEHAADRFAHDAALAHVKRALALLDAQPTMPGEAALRWRLLDRREITFQTMARRADQQAAIEALAAAADALDDDRLRADAASRMSHLCVYLGDYEGQKSGARRAMALADRASDQDLYLRAMRDLGDAHCQSGDWDAGQRVTQQCLDLARTRGLLHVQAQCLNTLARVATQRQDPVGRLQMHEQELALRKQLDDRRPEAVVLANLGGGWLDLGELFLGRQYCEEALRRLQAMGSRQAECGVLCNLSNLERWQGDSARALTLAHAAVQAALDAGSPPWEAYALNKVGDSLLALGQHAAATQAHERAQALETELRMPHEHETTAGLARAALVQGDFKTAMQHVQRVLDTEAATGLGHGANNPVRVDLVCHLVLASTGDARAPAWLQRAHGQLQAMAARISDPALRGGFLGNIPEHRAVMAAWAVAQEEGAAPARSMPTLAVGSG